MKTSLISRERVADLLCGAIEGGSNYWYYLPELDEVDKLYPSIEIPLVEKIINAVFDHNVSVKISDIENQDEILGYINLKNIAKAEKLMLKKHPVHFANVLKEEDDAETADVWFQLVVMKDIIFG